ncbi:MAG: trypsin-like peptidase domain-containing protein [Candidatus Lustribacter sp.]|jgi:S1-C subfamily serine protease
MLKTLLVGAMGAAIGATSVLYAGIGTGPARPAVNVAVAAGEDDEQRIVDAVKHVEPSVVALDVTINGTRATPPNPFGNMFGGGNSPFGFNFGGGSGGGQLQPFQEQASGSGFVLSNAGLIVTNDHVVHGASKITVVFDNGDRIAGHIYSENAAADLALVKVDNYAKLPPPVEFASSRNVEQGQWAIAIGEPFALKQTVTVGVVSAFDRDLTIGGQTIGGAREFKGLMQTSAPINPGNSGGPLINMDGQVIGVNQAVQQSAQDIGFAIPVDAVKTAVADLQRHPGSGSTAGVGFLGIGLEALDANVRSQLSYQGQGAAIVSVVSGSPADQAGLEPGDVIQNIDGKDVSSPADVTAIVQKLKPGQTASLHVWSNGTRQLVEVHVGSAPDGSD